MSEFRIFCIGAFVSAGFLAALDNYAVGTITITEWIAGAFIFACAAVALFGKKS